MADRSGSARVSTTRGHACLLACPIALALLCVLGEGTTHGKGLSPMLLVLLAMLIVTVGAVIGELWDVAFKLLTVGPVALRAGVWGTVAVGLAATSVADLGVLERLGSRYHDLALAMLCAAVIGAPTLAAILFGMQPSPTHPAGWIATHPRRRITWMVVLALLGLGCFAADRTVYVGLYPEGHDALRAGALGLTTFSLAIALRAVAWRFRARLAVGSVVVAIAIALLLAQRAGVMVGALSVRPWPRLVLATARWLTDVDLDGYSGLLEGGDCAPFTHAIHPGAPEIPGNGVDDNCLLGDAKPGKRPAAPLGKARAPVAMNVVLITIDSLRADHVGIYSKAYGPAGLDTTPKLDAFARDALVFDHAYSTGAWTAISVSSFMRGVYARRIAWTGLYETDDYKLVRSRARRGLRKMFALPLTDEHETLPQLLGRRGMRTIAVVDDGFSEMLSSRVRVAPGFERYREVDTLPKSQRNDAGTARLAIEEIARVPEDGRFFLWVHFFGPHVPTRHHKGIRLDGDGLVQGYDHEIRYADRHVAKLLRAVQARTTPTAIFVAADHGEDFFEKVRHHGSTVSPAATDVPLVARVPGWPHGRFRPPVSLLDLMPTILELTDTPGPGALDGRPIQSLLSEGNASARIVLCDTWRFNARGTVVVSASTAIGQDGRVVRDDLQNTWLVYARGNDEDGLPVDPSSPEPLVRALSRYIEETSREVDVR